MAERLVDLQPLFLQEPDPPICFESRAFARVADELLDGIRHHTGLFLLMGDAGMGKSTLLHRLKLSLADTACQVASVKASSIAESAGMLQALHRHRPLDPADTEVVEAPAVLLVDDAHELDDEVLQDLPQLLDHTRLKRIVLAAEPTLERKRGRPGTGELRKRIAAGAVLEPLESDEVGPYIEARLGTVGQPISSVFAPDAVAAIAFYADGNPRTVNRLCAAALDTAVQAHSALVTGPLVHRASADLEPYPFRLRNHGQNGTPRPDPAQMAAAAAEAVRRRALATVKRSLASSTAHSWMPPAYGDPGPMLDAGLPALTDQFLRPPAEPADDALELGGSDAPMVGVAEARRRPVAMLAAIGLSAMLLSVVVVLLLMPARPPELPPLAVASVAPLPALPPPAPPAQSAESAPPELAEGETEPAAVATAEDDRARTAREFELEWLAATMAIFGADPTLPSREPWDLPDPAAIGTGMPPSGHPARQAAAPDPGMVQPGAAPPANGASGAVAAAPRPAPPPPMPKRPPVDRRAEPEPEPEPPPKPVAAPVPKPVAAPTLGRPEPRTWSIRPPYPENYSSP